MNRIHVSRLVAVVATALVASIAAVAPSGTAGAGGWAVASLDEIPAPRAGETVEVGFTVLQHGITPAVLVDGPGAPLGIELTTADGTVEHFPATPDGPAGHYVAVVTVPGDAGEYAWRIQQGWFGPQELAPLTVSGGAGGATDAWRTVRWVTLAASAGLAAVAIADLVATRRRAAVAPT